MNKRLLQVKLVEYSKHHSLDQIQHFIAGLIDQLVELLGEEKIALKIWSDHALNKIYVQNDTLGEGYKEVIEIDPYIGAARLLPA